MTGTWSEATRGVSGNLSGRISGPNISALVEGTGFSAGVAVNTRGRSQSVNIKPGGLGTLGMDQLAWLAADLKGRSASTPLVVFAHMPLWTIYEPWGWGTGDADQLMEQLRRFGSVTVLNGHIHQIVQKVEGNVTFHTARSTAYPQPTAGMGSGPAPLKVAADQLAKMLGITSVSVVKHPRSLALSDTTIA